MKFIPSVLSRLLLANMLMTSGNSNIVSATSTSNNKNIFDADTSNIDVMSRVFVHYKPSHKTEVAETLGININPVGILSTVDDAVSSEVYYDFKKLESFVVSIPTSELEYLRNDPNILSIEEDHPRFLIPIIEEENDPSSSDSNRSLRGLQAQSVPYGVDMVEARDVWDANRDGIVDSDAPTGANRKICIIDTGFLASHEDLQGISVSGYNGNLPWNQDGNGHGTHVAGTIAAMNNNRGVVGVTPGTAQLYIVRVFGNDGNWAYSSTLIDAANRCAGAGANIINMSLGGSDPSEFERAKFDELNAQGILVIAAAGNDGNTDYNYPASYPSIMSVAAIDSSKNRASFSQRNSQVDIAAPGVGILSTGIPGGYASLSGTSMAAPHVSGVAALVWSAIPDATNTEVRDALIKTAQDLGVPGRDDMYGAGLVQGKKAIVYLTAGGGGTCGGGNIGNGICANAGECCSIFGWCGVTDEHCGSSSTCLDTPGWVDYEEDGCDWYETNDEPGCPMYGNFGGNMGSANDNCCHCIETGSPTDDPTSYAPTMALTMHPTLFSYFPTNFPTLGTEAPTSESPTEVPTKKPTTMQPTPKPTVKPTSAKPTTMKPTTMPTKSPTKVSTMKPTTVKPTPQPTLKPITSAKPTTLKPTTMKPTPKPTSKPTSAKPTTLKPTTMKPTPQPTSKPTSAKPTLKPTTQKPTTQKPTLKPTTKQPTNTPTEIPTSEAPTSEAPTTELPSTEAPTSEAPTTELPSTEAPTTKPTKMPTKKPTTMKPSTKKPTSK